MRDEVVELVEKIVKLPTLEERVEAKHAILDKLEDHKWDFRDPADFAITYDCDNCGLTFEEWEPEPDFQQPPSMPMRPFCRSCWDELAEHRWAEHRAGG